MPRGRFVSPTGSWGPTASAELARTDWTTTPVVDVATYLPATSRGFEDDRQRVELFRYTDAPGLSTYENGERSFRSSG